MKLSELATAAMIITMAGLILGSGILLFDKFSVTADDLRDVANESLTWLNNSNMSLDHGNVTSFAIYNDTGLSVSVDSDHYTLFDEAGQVFCKENATSARDGTTVYAVYTYNEYDTYPREVLTEQGLATANLSSDWIELIATIVAITIIIGLIVGAFMLKGMRQ